MTSMQVPTDLPEDIASASCDLAFAWRRSMRTVLSTAHLTCESAFFWVKPKLLSNPSSLQKTGTKVRYDVYQIK
jgi:hypothetical protein